MKRILSVFVFMLGCMSTYAKHVDITINTSCGYKYHVSEIGDNVTSKQMANFAEYIEDAFCG